MTRAGCRRALLSIALLWPSLAAVPAVAQTSVFERVGSVAEAANLVELDGKHLFASVDKTLKIFDLTDPAAPRVVGSFAFPERITAFAVSGTAVYAMTDGFGLRILDMSTPAAPALRGSLALRGSNQGLVAPGGNIVLFTNLSSGLVVIDVADAARPVRIASFVPDGYPRGVAASGAFAYLTDWPTGLYILTLAKRDAPQVVKLLTAPPAQVGTGDPRTFTAAVAVMPPTPAAPAAIVSVIDQGGLLHVFDATSPAAAVETATLAVPGTPRRIKVQGKRAYVAAGAAGVQVIDLANPAHPAIGGTILTKGPARDVAVNDAAVFVAAEGEIVVFRPGR